MQNIIWTQEARAQWETFKELQAPYLLLLPVLGILVALLVLKIIKRHK